MLLLCLLLVSATLSANAAGGSQPNILFVVVDDLGWFDVGWRNSKLYSPAIDRLALEGVVMNKAYGLQSCCPSRTAIMTGRYPFKFGLQQEGIGAGNPSFVPGEFTLIPGSLKTLGYETHAIGKWHLGFCNWSYVPTRRGFDTFYGYYNAEEDYFNHTGKKDGFDFRNNEAVDWSAWGQYSTNLFAARAVNIINDHDPSKPFFMYLAFQAVHGELQVPKDYIKKACKNIDDSQRKLKCAMIIALDEGIANVTAALRDTGLYENTIIVVTTDNGGPTEMAASNWPLRGGKITLWEGGTRLTSFIHAPYILQKSGYTWNELFHLVDWHSTLFEAAGGDPSLLSGLDGVSQWQSLLTGSSGPRDEFLYNINDIKNTSALRWKNFKLVQGFPGSPEGWYVPPEITNETTVEPPKVKHDPSEYTLYDLDTDPSERTNVLAQHPEVVQQMKIRLDEYKKSLHPSIVTDKVKASYPQYHNGVWEPGFC